MSSGYNKGVLASLLSMLPMFMPRDEAMELSEPPVIGFAISGAIFVCVLYVLGMHRIYAADSTNTMGNVM